MVKIIHLDKGEFDMIKDGKKKFEIRLGDKEIEEGDILTLVQRNEEGIPTDNRITKKVEYIQLTKDLPYWKKEQIDKFGFKIIQLTD